MDDTKVLKKIEELYKQSKFDEALNKCAKRIAELDIYDFSIFSLISKYYKIMFDCYFKQSDEVKCVEILNSWIRYARANDADIYKIHWNRIRLFIFTGYGEAEKIALLIEQCIGYYRSMDMLKAVADLLVIKGMFYKDAEHMHEAIKIYESLEEDMSASIDFAKNQIKLTRHLK